MIGFPSVGKSTLLTTLTTTQSESAVSAIACILCVCVCVLRVLGGGDGGRRRQLRDADVPGFVLALAAGVRVHHSDLHPWESELQGRQHPAAGPAGYH